MKQEQLKPEYDEVAGIVIKYRDVCDPDIVVLKLHNEIQMMNIQLVEQLKDSQKLKKEKSNIQGLNFVIYPTYIVEIDECHSVDEKYSNDSSWK